MLPELFVNPPTPGLSTPWAWTTLATAVTTTPAAGTVETWTVNAAPPAGLAKAGQFRFVIDGEICMDITGGAGTARQIQRGAEGSTTATHGTSSSLYVVMTAGAFENLAQLGSDGTIGGPSGSPVNANLTQGAELGYAQITSNQALGTTLSDIAGLAVTVTVGTRPIKVIFDCQSLQISLAGNYIVLNINEGATVLTSLQTGIASANSLFSGHREVRLSPTVGSHTYKVQAAVNGTAGANDRIVALTTSPAFIQVVQI